MGWTPPDGIAVPEWRCCNHWREAYVPEVTTIGLDIAKNVCHAHGADERGHALFSNKLSWGKVLDFFAASLPAPSLWKLAAVPITGVAS